MKKIDSRGIDRNAIELIGKDWMLVTAGDFENYNTMTASWGALGELWHKPVAFVFIRPQRYTYEFTEKNETMTLSFFSEEYKKALQICGTKSGRDYDKVAEAGLTPFETETGGVAFREAELILECRKLYADFINKDSFIVPELVEKNYQAGDFHKMYIVEIVNAWKR